MEVIRLNRFASRGICNFVVAGMRMQDFAPTQHEFKRPVYAIDAGVTKTGTTECYFPKGNWVNPDKRCWLKYEAWQPPKA